MATVEVQAASYVFPGNLPSGCGGSGGSYTCSSLTLAWNDSISIVAPKPANIRITGDFYIANARINSGGSPDDLSIDVTGNLSGNTSALLIANVNVGGNATIPYATTITGRLGVTGQLNTGTSDTFNGTIVTGGNANLSSYVTVTGDLSSGGAVTTGSRATLGGKLTASGDINLGSPASVSGEINSGGNLSVGYQSTMGGSSTARTITDNGNSTFRGDVTATAGSVTLGSGSSVTGHVSAGSGSIALGSGSTVTGNVQAGSDLTTQSSVTLNGTARAGRNLTLGSGGVITGDTDVGGTLSTGWQARISGNATAAIVSDTGNSTFGAGVTATGGNLTLGSYSQVTGDATALLGAISLSNQTRIGGNVIARATSGGSINLGSGGSISGCALTGSTAANSIVLGWSAQAGGVCCQSGGSCLTTGNACYGNNSGRSISTEACGDLASPSQIKVGNCSVSGVSTSFSTIQAAANAVAAGGTVWICPGTYRENVSVSGKAVAFQSSTGNVGDVTITPSGSYQAAISSDSPLTVNNLSISGTNSQGNGISICPSSPATLALSGVNISVPGRAIYQAASCQGLRLQLANIQANSSGGSGIEVRNGTGDHVVDYASASGVNGAGWPISIAGGSSVTLTDVDAAQSGSSRSNYAALSLSNLSGSVTIGTSRKQTVNYTTEPSNSNAYGILICAANGSSIPVTISHAYANGSIAGIYLNDNSSCGSYTAHFDHVTAVTGGAYSANGYWPYGIRIGHATGIQVFDQVSAGDSGTYVGILQNGGGATFTDTLATGSSAALSLAPSDTVTISNPNRGVSIPYQSGPGGTGIYICPLQDNTAINIADTSVQGGANGGILATPKYCYKSATLTLANVTATATGSSAVYVSRGTGAHSLTNVSATSDATAIYIYGGAAATYSGITATCGSDESTAGMGLYLGSQSNATLTGINNITCKSPNSYGIYLYGCPKCTISGATVDMNNASGSMGIYADTGSGGHSITGNEVRNAPNNGIRSDAYPPGATVTGNIVANSGSERNAYGINMTRGAGAAYNNCLYNDTVSRSEGHDDDHSSTRQNGNSAGATFCGGSDSSCRDGTRTTYGTLSQGNFWGSWPKGNGYSDSCEDDDKDGVCDKKYMFNGGAFDYYPLSSCGITVATPKPALEYRMDEAGWSGSPGDVIDTSGTLNGSSTGGAKTRSPGFLCRAGDFTTKTAWVNLGHPDLPGGDHFTISTWINWQIPPATGNYWANILTYNAVARSDSGVFWLQHRSDNGVLEFAVQTVKGRQYIQATRPTVQNQWQHVVGVYDGSTISIYIDGVLQGSRSQSGDLATPPADALLTIGRWANSNNNFRQFNGWVDEVKLFSQPLTPSQVMGLYQNEASGKNWDGRPRTCMASPVADYHLDETSLDGTAGEVKDSSANHFDGTANGAQPVSAGQVCGATSFSGLGQDIQIPAGTSLNDAFGSSSGMTFMAWAKPSAYGTVKILQKGDWDGSGLAMDLWNGWQASFRINGVTTSAAFGSRPSLNQWYHLAGSYDGASVTLYVNGQAVKATAASGSLSSNSRPVIIGSAGGQKYFSGLIDEAHVFPSALSPAQIAAIYANEAAGRNWDGNNRTCAAVATGPSALNAVDTGTNGLSGAIGTKLAGTAFNLDLYALNAARTALDTLFSGQLQVDLLANTSTGVALNSQNCPISGSVLSVGSTTLAAGRGSVAVPAIANVWRDVRVRLSWSGTPSLVSCSSDNFAVRPSAVTLSTTAGAAAPALGSPVIKAGAGFTLAASTSPTGYGGTLALDSSQLSAQTPNQLSSQQAGGYVGNLCASRNNDGSCASTALIANAGGNGNASYDDVGYLYLGVGAFRDDSFTQVDQGNGGCITAASDPANHLSDVAVNGKYGCAIGNKVGVSLGRFIPDHLALVVVDAPPACGSFTYFGQDMPVHFSLVAQSARNTTTRNYQGSLARLDLASFSALGFLPAAIGQGSSPPSGTWSSGVANPVTATLAYARPTTVSAPATIAIQAQPRDADGVTTDAPASFGSSLFRYGRVRLQNGYGNPRLDLALTMRSEYWSGNAWMPNSADICTDADIAIAAAGASDISSLTCVRDGQGASGSGCGGATPAGRQFMDKAVTGFTGAYNLWLKAPGVAGSVDVTAILPTWLQFNWNGSVANPTARASFGTFKSGPVIYRRENF